MYKLLPSILEADFYNLGMQIDSLRRAGISSLHIDVMDGHFVPNIALGPQLIRSIKDNCSMEIDVHLMLDNPYYFIDIFAKSGAGIISVHLETLDDSLDFISKINSYGSKSGICINPETDVEHVYRFLRDIDVVTVMSVNPGFGSQSFKQEVLHKVVKLRDYISLRGYSTIIQLDGGINLNNMDMCIRSGADNVVMGSAIFKSDSIYETAFYANEKLMRLYNR